MQPSKPNGQKISNTNIIQRLSILLVHGDIKVMNRKVHRANAIGTGWQECWRQWDWNKGRVERVTAGGWMDFVCLLVACLTSQQQASVSQGRICSDNFTCCHTEIEVADQTFYLTQSQYTDTGPTSPSADPISPGAWQGSHWSANF